MNIAEKGFTLVELAITIALIAGIGSAAATTVVQIIQVTERNNNRMVTIRQVQNASYWIGRDTRRADSMVTDNLTPPDFLLLTWTERDYDGGSSTYHSVTYFFEGLSGGIGRLKRNHWSSAGASEYTLVAEYVYYNPGDSENTSMVSYQNRVLTLRLTALFGDASESAEYRITRRPSLN